MIKTVDQHIKICYAMGQVKSSSHQEKQDVCDHRDGKKMGEKTVNPAYTGEDPVCQICRGPHLAPKCPKLSSDMHLAAQKRGELFPSLGDNGKRRGGKAERGAESQENPKKCQLCAEMQLPELVVHSHNRKNCRNVESISNSVKPKRQKNQRVQCNAVRGVK